MEQNVDQAGLGRERLHRRNYRTLTHFLGYHCSLRFLRNARRVDSHDGIVDRPDQGRRVGYHNFTVGNNH